MVLRWGAGLMTLLATAALAGPPASSWVTGEEVDAVDRRDKLSALIARLATAEVKARRWLNAHALAETCMGLDRHRCSCVRDWALGLAGMPSADAQTLAAVRRTAAAGLIDYASCAQTAPDAGEMFALGQKWSAGKEVFAGLSSSELAGMGPAELLTEANKSSSRPLRYRARILLEACVQRQPVECECVRRLGDLWSVSQVPDRAIVWWGRALACNPKAAYARDVRLEIEAARSRIKDNGGAAAIAPASMAMNVSVRPGLGRARLQSGRAAVREKRLDDAVFEFQACSLITTDNADCLLELGRVLDRLGRPREALGVWLEVSGVLKNRDPRLAEVKRRLAPP